MTTHPIDDFSLDTEKQKFPDPTRRPTMQILDQLRDERLRQDKKWGQQNHNFPYFMQILGEELGECSRAFLEKDRTNLRTELVQSAAVLVAMIECGDRNDWFDRQQTPQAELTGYAAMAEARKKEASQMADRSHRTREAFMVGDLVQTKDYAELGGLGVMKIVSFVERKGEDPQEALCVRAKNGDQWTMQLSKIKRVYFAPAFLGKDALICTDRRVVDSPVATERRDIKRKIALLWPGDTVQVLATKKAGIALNNDPLKRGNVLVEVDGKTCSFDLTEIEKRVERRVSPVKDRRNLNNLCTKDVPIRRFGPTDRRNS